MVAELGKAINGLSVQRQKFAALVAQGATLHCAYKLVYSATAGRRTAEVAGSRLAAIPEVAEAIRALRAASWSQDAMIMQERRSLLASIARTGAKRKATASDAIRAIAEDATLAGERRNDDTQLSLSVDVGVSVVIAALRGQTGGAALPEPQPVDISPAGLVVQSAGHPEPRLEIRGNAGAIPAEVHAPAALPDAVCGPLGFVEAPAPVMTASPASSLTNGHKPAFVDTE